MKRSHDTSAPRAPRRRVPGKGWGLAALCLAVGLLLGGAGLAAQAASGGKGGGAKAGTEKPAAGVEKPAAGAEKPAAGADKTAAPAKTGREVQRDAPLPAAVLAREGLSVVLGRPTGTSVSLNLLGNRDQEVFLEYGTSEGAYGARSPSLALVAGKAAELEIGGLAPGTGYFYRLQYRLAGGAWTPGPAGRWRTRPAPGAAFSFEIIGDSHPERPQQFDPSLYAQNLAAAAADAPDFFMTIGDDFSVDTLAEITPSAVESIYRRQRSYLSLVGSVAPLFLVNGNHEQASLANLDGTAENVAVWAQTWRNGLFPQPAPDAFYTGDSTPVPHIGLLRDYYAFTWGDALFVVIDPYWHSKEAVDNVLGGGDKRRDLWGITLGDEQYAWFRKTLAESRATFKFVFSHHVSGTGRGGVERAPYFEWGGLGADGKPGFAAARPGWEAPIHELMVRAKVTAFVQGHDHVFAHQVLDGVSYITLPEPADPTYTLYNKDAFTSGDILPNSGRVRFTVGPERVVVEYLREWLPAARPAAARAGEAAYRVEIPAGGPPGKGRFGEGQSEAGAVATDSQPKPADKAKGGAAGGAGGASAGAGVDGASATGAAGAAGAKAGGQDKAKEKGAGGGAAPPAAGQGAQATDPEEGPPPPAAGSLDARTLIEYPGPASVGLATVFLQDVDYYYEWGDEPSRLDRKTPQRTAAAGSVARDTIAGLAPGRAYAYRLAWAARGSGTFSRGETGRFSTMKAPGASFSFVIEADPHIDGNSSGTGYLAALAGMAAGGSDFAIDLGDTSMAEKLASDAATALARNRLVRSYWDEVGGSLPFMMVLGNHDGEHGWPVSKNLPSSAESSGLRRTWLTDIRQAPAAGYDVFSDTAYAFTWGDALLIVLDPYAAESQKPGEDGWAWTLGKKQYDWLAAVLAKNQAKYRFVFIHNMLGGTGKDARGGADFAGLYEWGGREADGTMAFAARRPGWAMPIHDLFLKHKVDAVFRGHDHFYAREERDGIVYQLVPQPSLARPQRLDPAELADYGYSSGTFLPSPGWLRVSVSPSRARVEYLGAAGGAVLHSWDIAP